MTSEELMVIDNDAGTDDAQAILMALANPRMRVLALTTVTGNTLVDQVALNCLRVLQAANRLDIPVYKGCTEPLLGTHKDNHVNNGFHGNDGLGDAPDPNAPDSSHLCKEHAVQALVQLVNQYPGQINLVAIGPLTNVALAIRQFPEFGSKLKHCYIMGGNMAGRGNRTVSAEFNFAADPEAAYIVLNQLKCPITVATLELCRDYALDWDWYINKFINVNTNIGRFIKKINAKMEEKFKKILKHDKCPAWDQVIMAVAIDNSVSIEMEHVYASVELGGEMTRGQVVIDWQNKFCKEPNVYLLKKIEQEKFLDLLFQSVCGQVDQPR